MDAASIPAVNQTTTSADTRDRGTHGSGEDITIQDLIRNWGESDPSSDLNEDGIVDLDDLLLLLEKRSSSNGVINSLMEAPNAAIEGLASLGGLLMEALLDRKLKGLSGRIKKEFIPEDQRVEKS